MRRMMGAVSQGAAYYDRFEEFAYLAKRKMSPIMALDDGRRQYAQDLAAFEHNGSLLNDPGEKGWIDSKILFRSILEHIEGRAHEDMARATRAVREESVEKYGGFTVFFFSSRRRHTRSDRDWSSDVCSSD